VRLDFEAEFKAARDGSFKGLASSWRRDRAGDVVQRGAFAHSLSEWSRKGAKPPLLWMHRGDQPIGTLSEIKETDVGLAVAGRIMHEAGEVERRALEHVRSGSARGLSIGYLVGKGGESWDSARRVRTLTQVDLLEISVVCVPCNQDAAITEVKGTKTLNASGAAHAAKLVEAGRIDDTDAAWQAPDAAHEDAYLRDHTMAEFGAWFLGEDKSADETSKARWAYPYSDNFSDVSLAGLRAIISRGSAQGATAIVERARTLLEKAKAKSKTFAPWSNKRHLELALRDAGLSVEQAKRLISGGWSSLVRDAEAADRELLVKVARQLTR